MIRFIKGIFHAGPGSSAIIETASGMGFEVHIPAGSALYKNQDGDMVKVFTSMIVREDDVSLYGFSDKESLDLFELLITVSGVGAKAAMAVMSVLPPMELKRAVAGGDAKAISAANGVGKKTAERIILELKDKVGTFEPEDGADFGAVLIPAGSQRSEAAAALIALGYTRAEAEDAVGRVKDEDLSCEDYIKHALKNLF